MVGIAILAPLIPFYLCCQSLCPVVATENCHAATSQWNMFQSGSWATANASSQVINVDCDSCTIGTHAKLISGTHYSSALSWDAEEKQIQVVSCPGMCLTNGQVSGALPSCAGNEPYVDLQVHVDNCSSLNTHGWTVTAVGPVTVATNVTISAFGAYLQVGPVADYAERK